MVEGYWLDFFKKHNIEGRVNHYTYSKKVIHYASIGKDNLPALLFLSDASSIEHFIHYFNDETLLREFSIYASEITSPLRTAKNISIQHQAEIICPLTERIHRVHQPLIIVASGYTAAIACQCIASHPGVVQALVLIEPVLRIEPTSKSWFRTILEKIFAGNKKKRKRGDNKSKILFSKQLEKMDTVWKKIDIPVIYFHSVRDKFSSRAEGAFVSKLFMNSPELEIEFYQTGKERIEVVKFNEIKNKIVSLNNVIEVHNPSGRFL